ncbi:hypothetical protein KZX45_18140 [Georgenia sp. EYE_87]|uniref:hypothetical protein n=1 Tax=Georgenia sp. EYE_87 TaxID=2853448 RepID=UPI0020045D2C|nr:hypothetical protein [Georgenia sp. EYE_87]MCK6212467.1 hypothetical protein [Georgenia sp. EYE_87]
MIMRRAWRRTGLALSAVLVAPLVVAVMTGAAVVSACVPASGAWSEVALRLALLRPDAACPEGTLAPGAEPGQALTVVVAVALPSLLAHLALISGAAGLVGSARRVTAARIRRFVAVVAPGAPPVLRDDRAAPLLPAPHPRPVRTVVARRPWRRGPPAAQAAGA